MIDDEPKIARPVTALRMPPAVNQAMTAQTQPEAPEARFAFGQNWRRFAPLIDEERIRTAMDSLQSMLEVSDLTDRSFLDIGCGSGLFSLAALRLGARRVVSFDYDADSVACTEEVRRRYYPDSESWVVEQASVLSSDYMAQVGEFDVIYAWGVLHHTGSMWKALANAAIPAAAQGRLFVAIYNDQGAVSVIWRWIKRLYCSNRLGRFGTLATLVPLLVVVRALKDVFGGINPTRRYSADYSRASRGMSPLRDLVDWLGGYPFEVATPEKIVNFYRSRDFVLRKMKKTTGSGCNEFVFLRQGDDVGGAVVEER